MELQIHAAEQLAPIKSNLAEIKKEVQQSLEKYQNLVYTPEQVTTAKADIAKLRKLAKSLEDARIRVKKEYEAPYDQFAAEVKEITGLIANTIKPIDDFVKESEQREKAEKKNKILALWHDKKPFEWLSFDRFFIERMLNKTERMESIEKDMDDYLESVSKEFAAAEKLSSEFKNEIVLKFQQTLNLAECLTHLTELQKMKEAQTATHDSKASESLRQEVAKEEAEQQENEQVYFATFTARGTMKQLKELVGYMAVNGIKYEKREDI